MRMAQVFAAGIMSYADHSTAEKFSGGRPCVQDSDVSEIFKLPDLNAGISLPHEVSFIDVTNSPLLHSSVKLAEKADDVILRVWNPQEEAISFSVQTDGNRKICKTDLLENRNEAVEIADDRAVVPGKAGEIITLKIKNK